MSDGADELDFAGAVRAVVDLIPAGHVMTYGDVAATLGSRGARAVGRVLAESGATLAWWRVIRSDGRPPVGHEAEAVAHYRAEGTPLRADVAHSSADRMEVRVDLARARWEPDLH
jgi:alkylated DNA nucleotide flippase Atl1